jgi:hypothetical protein
VSRASILNFLNAMCDDHVLDFEEETCKCEMRRKYKKVAMRKAIRNILLQRF